MPNSREILFAGNEPGHSSRFYVQSIGGGATRQISPEGFATIGIPAVSLDGKQFAALDQHTNVWNVCQVADGKCTPVQGSSESDTFLQWSTDGKYVYSAAHDPEPALWRIEIPTGNRQLWKRITPVDPVGAFYFSPRSITPDGKSFVVQYVRSLDQLYLVEGVI
jgi:hypothetical protein